MQSEAAREPAPQCCRRHGWRLRRLRSPTTRSSARELEKAKAVSGLGLKACERGCRVVFASAQDRNQLEVEVRPLERS